MDYAARVINGTFLEVWMDGLKVGEADSFQIKVSFNKATVNMCGQMWEETKVTSVKGTGSLGMFKVNSRMASAHEKAMSGKDVRFTLVGKLADPDAYGNERISIHNVHFDDLTLMDATANNIGKITAPFTFREYKFLDSIAVQ